VGCSWDVLGTWGGHFLKEKFKGDYFINIHFFFNEMIEDEKKNL
jgi:hypothetical protein